MKYKFILLVLGLVVSTSLSAQIIKPTKWEFITTASDIKLGGEVELVFKVILDRTWHLYSNIQNYEIGPLPASFVFEPHPSYQLIGKVKPIGTKTEYDEVFEVNVNYFEKNAEFRQKIKILAKNPIIKGTYSYQVCTTIDGKCILGDDDFEFKIKTTN